MADYVKVIVLRDTPEIYQALLCGSSDGTGEAAVSKIDISAIAMAATKVKVRALRWSVTSEGVELLFDHNTDQSIAILTGNGKLDDVHQAPIVDAGSAGGAGDILLTTHGAQANVSNYTIFIELQKVS